MKKTQINVSTRFLACFFALVSLAGCVDLEAGGEEDVPSLGTTAQGLVDPYYALSASGYAAAWYNLANYTSAGMFHDFSNEGGDCTNFASQAILAGLTHSTSRATVWNARYQFQDKAYPGNDWWYSYYAATTGRAMPNWAGANGLYRYLKTQAANPTYRGLQVRLVASGTQPSSYFQQGEIISKVNVSDYANPRCAVGEACHTAVVVSDGSAYGSVIVAYRNAPPTPPNKVPLAQLVNSKYQLYQFHINGFAR